ncbi:glycosyltransferase, partial [Streptosporangium algeriense]
ERVGVPSVSVTFQQLTLPSPYHAPLAYPGRPFPPEVTDRRTLWDLDARSINELFGEALNVNRVAAGLPPVDDVRGYVVGARPWLATDPVLDPWRETPELDVVQTGAWTLPDERPLPAELTAFLEAGEPPVYVGFGSMPMRAAKTATNPTVKTATEPAVGNATGPAKETAAGSDAENDAGTAPEGAARSVAEVVVEAVRARGRRVVVARGWADLAPIDDQDDCFVVGEVNQQALFRRVAAVVHHGGAGTTTT